MEISGFNENNISERNKEALQSETWQEVREVMKTEIQHFTEAPEIQHFAVEKVSKNDNVYGVTWGNLVREYLETAYSDGNTQAEVVSFGVTYKVLKRGEVTAFYDADGNTLFDVENRRLEKEYEWVMNDAANANAENINLEEGKADVAEEENANTFKEEADTETGEASKTERAENEEENSPDVRSEADDNVISAEENTYESPASTEAVATDKGEHDKSAKQSAKDKLEKELKGAKDKSFADPIIRYLLKRCAEDEGLARDVIQKHKTWEKCFDYIYAQARKQSKGNRAAVRDDVVYEWAEDYYHKDDKAEEEKAAKKAAEAKAKREKAAAEKKAIANDKTAGAAARLSPKKDRNAEKPTPAKEEKQKEQAKPKKKGKEMEGQLDMFSMMGM